MLPTSEEFTQLAQEMIGKSNWLAGIGLAPLQKAFDLISRQAKLIVNTEDSFDSKHSPTPTSSLKEGAWVCSPSTGVTEVLKLRGKNVELARIGDSSSAKGPLLVTAKIVQPTRMSRKL